MNNKKHIINTRLIIIQEYIDIKTTEITNVEVSNILIKSDGVKNTQSIKLINTILSSL